jgi:hypothetical protein
MIGEGLCAYADEGEVHPASHNPNLVVGMAAHRLALTAPRARRPDSVEL